MSYVRDEEYFQESGYSVAVAVEEPGPTGEDQEGHPLKAAGPGGSSAGQGGSSGSALTVIAAAFIAVWVALGLAGKVIMDASHKWAAVGMWVVLIAVLLTMGTGVSGAGVKASSTESAHIIGLKGWYSGSCPLALSAQTENQSIPSSVGFCIDSGATCVCIPEEEEWMLSEVTDWNPNI